MTNVSNDHNAAHSGEWWDLAPNAFIYLVSALPPHCGAAVAESHLFYPLIFNVSFPFNLCSPG